MQILLSSLTCRDIKWAHAVSAGTLLPCPNHDAPCSRKNVSPQPVGLRGKSERDTCCPHSHLQRWPTTYGCKRNPQQGGNGEATPKFLRQGWKKRQWCIRNFLFSFGSSCCFPRRQALVGSGNRMWAEALGMSHMPWSLCRAHLHRLCLCVCVCVCAWFVQVYGLLLRIKWDHGGFFCPRCLLYVEIVN